MAEKKKRTPLHYRVLWGIMADPAVGAPAKCVATVLLLQFRNHQTGVCNPSFTTIGKRIGRSRRPVIDAINELKAAGWIKWEGTSGGGSSNTNNFEFLLKQTGAEVSTPTSVENSTGAENSTTGAEVSTQPVLRTAHDLSIEPSSNHSSAARCLVDEEEKQRGVSVRCESPAGQRWQRYWRENGLPEAIRSTRTDSYLMLPSEEPPAQVENAA